MWIVMKTTDFLLTNVTVHVRVPAVAFPFVNSENGSVRYNHLWASEHLLPLKHINTTAITNYHNCILLSFINCVYLTNLFLLLKKKKIYIVSSDLFCILFTTYYPCCPSFAAAPILECIQRATQVLKTSPATRSNAVGSVRQPTH